MLDQPKFSIKEGTFSINKTTKIIAIQCAFMMHLVKYLKILIVYSTVRLARKFGYIVAKLSITIALFSFASNNTFLAIFIFQFLA